MKQLLRCPLCNGQTFNQYLTCTDYTVSNEQFALVKCSQCNFTLTNPVPDDDRIGDYYQSDEYISHNRKATGVVERIYLIARNFTLNWKASLLEKQLTPSLPKVMLDYGCGTGDFITHCATKGWTVSGIEPSDRARAQAEEVSQTTVAPSLQQATIKQASIITLWHVLEHVPNLDETLQQLRTILHADGTMFIAVPNHTSWDGRHYAQLWAGYDVPRHLWHFSQSTMATLLHKNNLRIVDTIPMRLDAFYISLLSEKYRAGNRLTLAGMIRAFINGLRSNSAARKQNEYSSLIYVVRK